MAAVHPGLSVGPTYQLPIHYGIGCHLCRMSPISGSRYQCQYCQNVDLCEKCWIEESHPHPIKIIKWPGDPGYLINTELYYPDYTIGAQLAANKRRNGSTGYIPPQQLPINGSPYPPSQQLPINGAPYPPSYNYPNNIPGNNYPDGYWGNSDIYRPPSSQQPLPPSIYQPPLHNQNYPPPGTSPPNYPGQSYPSNPTYPQIGIGIPSRTLLGTEQPIHYGISCSGCKLNPIRGLRYQCKQCPTNYCGDCFFSKMHGHPFDTIGGSGQVGTQLPGQIPSYGQPPYVQPPYGQPPYGQPPYGQVPPYQQQPGPKPPNTQMPIHAGTTCSTCHTTPIVGNRYFCSTCNKSYCQNCQLTGIQDPHQLNVISPGQDELVDGGTPPLAIHPQTQCSVCQMNPIVGPRYKCKTCVNYDLCYNCYSAPHQHEHKSFDMQTQADVPVSGVPIAPPSGSATAPKPSSPPLTCAHCGKPPDAQGSFLCLTCATPTYFCKTCIDANVHPHQTQHYAAACSECKNPVVQRYSCSTCGYNICTQCQPHFQHAHALTLLEN